MFKRISLSEALDLLDPLALMKAKQEANRLNALADEYERRAKAEMAKVRPQFPHSEEQR